MREFKLILCLAFLGNGWSQNLPDSVSALKTVHTPDVLVQSRRAELPQMMNTTPGTVMLADEIQEKSPEDLGDLTSRFSGVFVRSYGGAGGLKTLNARGLGSQHFLIVNNHQALLFNQMGSANLGDIQVDGLASVVYAVGGSDSWDLPALAKTYSGVLHLKYLENDSGNKDHVHLQMLGASFGRYKLSGSLLKSTKRVVFYLQAYGYEMAGEFPYRYKHGLVNVEGQRNNNFTREASGRFGANMVINGSNKIQIAAQFLQAYRELPGAIVFYHPHHYQELGNRQANLNLRHDYEYQRVKFIHFANFSQTTTDYRDSFHIVRPQWQHFQERNWDVGQNGQFDLKKIKFNWSGHYVHSSLFSNRADILLPKRHRAIAHAGLELALSKVKFRCDMPVQYVSDQLWMSPNQNRILFTPSFGINSTRSRDVSISVFRASLGRFARMATFSEMYYMPMSNPNLRPEISQMLNIGFHHKRFAKRVQFNIGIDAFYGLIRDKIIAIPTQNLFIWSVRNLQTVKSYGFDALMSATYNVDRIESQLIFSHKSSLNVAKDISHEESVTYGHQIPYTPYWLHHSELTWELKHFGATYSYAFNDFRFVLGENIAANVLDAFHIHDLRFYYNLRFGHDSRHTFRFHFKINNLLDQQYQVMRGFPMPGRNFETGLTWRF